MIVYISYEYLYQAVRIGHLNVLYALVTSLYSCELFFYFTDHGVKFLFPIQAQTFDHVFDGKDVIAQAR